MVGSNSTIWHGATASLDELLLAAHENQYSVGDSLPSTLANVLYPFEAENSFRAEPYLVFTYNTIWFSVVVALVYVVLVFAGARYMKDKQPYNLNLPMRVWNLFLSVFSFMGAARVVPHSLFGIANYGLDHDICTPGLWLNGPVGFWMMLFSFSKYIELIDTLFLVLRKKPVIFLHWYHHATVLVFLQVSYGQGHPCNLMGTAINYSIHAVMYFYYFLMACGHRPKWAGALTLCQIVQMVIGFTATAYQVVQMTSDSRDCAGSWPTIYFSIVLFLSYFALFMNFAVKRYIFPREKSVSASESKKRK